ncbi:dihydroxyacetone kinase family protein [Acuticoccus kandeliae]|uniref:dihydroxyacetone kinase family protein n=1 Tax=Acuticoccus kandeliae TaxID=2073160 RepID=UPI000D3E0D2A|nr:dihydroxyacetone kinase family protein [Acuticoccus kandeliae]
MKKLINRPQDVVRETLMGLAATTPHLVLAQDYDIILRSDLPAPAERKVALISGGGSGHEPAHAGYVGRGMLTAAVAGDVFTSPDVDSILAAIRAVTGPAGALLVVKNYTGDRLNFGLAAELARQEGLPVEIVVVADDVSLRETMPRARWRGIAGTVFVHKIAGAAAEAGADLASVAALARAVADSLATMGVGLGSCIVPGTGVASFTLAPGEVEFGLGIHGEEGVRRAALADAATIVRTLVDAVSEGIPASPAALLVNGLGGTPPMELSLVAGLAVAELRARGFDIIRAFTGSFMTALEMPGVSLTLLPLAADWSGHLDAATAASAWPGAGAVPAEPATVALGAVKSGADDGAPADPALVAILQSVIGALNAAKDELTELDAKAGDGDLGVSMARAAAALDALPASAAATPGRLAAAAADALRRAIGGSSGPFYAVALLRAAERLGDSPTRADIADALAAAASAISELGGAKPGDRTMLDALAPATDGLRSAPDGGPAALARATADAARAGAEATRTMKPALGRASYLGERVIGTPDGGAVAVAIWLDAIANALESRQRT